MQAVRCEPSGVESPLRLCVFACQTHSHAKAQRRKENEDTGITTVLAGRGWAIPLSSSPHAVCSHASGTVRAVRCRITFASLRLCVPNTFSRQGAKAQRKRGYWYNDGAGGAIPLSSSPRIACPHASGTARAVRCSKRAGLISLPQPIIKTSGGFMSPLQGFVCFLP